MNLRRFPALTLAVLVVTAAVNIAGLAAHGVLTGLERTPAGLHGDWWRTGTSLFVQDGGLVGTASNLLFLAVIGAMAEQVMSRPRWLLHYFGVGLLTELIAYAWQPTGGGNSIAICGLAGGLALALWRADPRLPNLTAPALMIWSGVLLATLSSAASIPGIVAGAIAAGLVKAGRERGIAVERPAALAVTATGLALAACQNIHGAALVLGIVLACLLRRNPEC